MGNPFGIWMVFLANWSGNRTYPGAGALLGRPYRKGLIVGDKPFSLYNVSDSVRIDPEFDTFENKKCSQRAWLCAL